jgi:hypothetical protein
MKQDVYIPVHRIHRNRRCGATSREASMPQSLHQYRAAFSRTISCAEKQIALRHIRNALALRGRNDGHVAELTALLPMLLAIAQERTLKEWAARA